MSPYHCAAMDIMSYEQTVAWLRERGWRRSDRTFLPQPIDPTGWSRFTGKVCTDGMAATGTVKILINDLANHFLGAPPFAGGVVLISSAWSPDGEDIILRQLLKPDTIPPGPVVGPGFLFAASEFDGFFSLAALSLAFSWTITVVPVGVPLAFRADHENRLTIVTRAATKQATEFLLEMGYEQAASLDY